MNKDKFFKEVMEHTQISNRDDVRQIVKIIFSILSHRLLVDESNQVKAQLPVGLKELWVDDVWVTNFLKMNDKKLKYRHKAQMIALIENEFKRNELHYDVEMCTKAVLHQLKEAISDGETRDIIAQLPEEVALYFLAA